MSTPLDRTSLYEMVRNKPITKVAEDLGISDAALHKICRKHRIRMPPRGHSVKLAAGKPVKIAPLFGNDRRVPEWWLERYGNLLENVQFSFLTDDGQLDLIN